MKSCAVRRHRTPAAGRLARQLSFQPSGGVWWESPCGTMRLAELLHRTLEQVCSAGLKLREDACVRMPCCGFGRRSRGWLSLVHGGALGHEVDCQVADGSCDIRLTDPHRLVVTRSNYACSKCVAAARGRSRAREGMVSAPTRACLCRMLRTPTNATGWPHGLQTNRVGVRCRAPVSPSRARCACTVTVTGTTGRPR